ncbi:MAG: hypothetical protein AUJ75_03820 [Candidatus Omnitrophica bacterium CG1_02_49_10]|nr:MAG: hypothetical protein AUJ75_03820 [Candidatus Omnitrophica bacterium CG1_02_49_10]
MPDKIGVLAGGVSSEREVSLASGRAVHKALTDEGLNAVIIDLGENYYSDIMKADIDFAFISLHGGPGEDGTVQMLLEYRDIPYTGSGVAASRAAMNKAVSHSRFASSGIPAPRHNVLWKGEEVSPGGLKFPLVVKPACEGSSIGLTIVDKADGFLGAVNEAFKYGKFIIIEEYIKGSDITVGIIGEEALPVIKIVPKARFYDYRSKYTKGMSEYLVPAPIDSVIYKKAQDLALKTHRALGLSGFSRIDMILGEDGDIYVLEANSIPGMTETSLLPKAAGAMGIDFNKMCLRLVDLGIESFEKRKGEDGVKKPQKREKETRK